MVSIPEPARIAEIRRRHPGLLESLDAGMSEYLAQARQRGVSDGLGLAIKVAEELLPGLMPSQRRVVEGLIDALRDAQVVPEFRVPGASGPAGTLLR